MRSDTRRVLSSPCVRRLTGLVAVVLGLVLVGCSNQPVDSDDCILANVKPGLSDAGAQLVAAACRGRFSEAETGSRPIGEADSLSEDARAKLTGRIGPSEGTTWTGSLYNGNEKWIVEEVEVEIRSVQPEPGSRLSDALAASRRQPERYVVGVKVPPLSAREFHVTVNWNPADHYEWKLVAARGVSLE